MADKETRDRFYEKIRTEQVRFVINDLVRVTSGTHSGRTGSVISVESIEPATVYLVETDDHSCDDILLPQDSLELVGQ